MWAKSTPFPSIRVVIIIPPFLQVQTPPNSAYNSGAIASKNISWNSHLEASSPFCGLHRSLLSIPHLSYVSLSVLHYSYLLKCCVFPTRQWDHQGYHLESHLFLFCEVLCFNFHIVGSQGVMSMHSVISVSHIKLSKRMKNVLRSVLGSPWSRKKATE